MKPRLIFILTPRFDSESANPWHITKYLESDVLKVKHFLKKRKVGADNVQVLYLKDELRTIAQSVTCQIGSCDSICLEEMFLISKNIINNNLPYETSFFNNKCFAAFSKHNQTLICHVLEQAVNEIPGADSEVLIFIVKQKHLEEEWPYHPGFFSMLESSFTGDALTYSPIALDLHPKFKSITNL